MAGQGDWLDGTVVTGRQLGKGDWLDEMSGQGDWLDGTVVTGRADVRGQRSWMWLDEGTQFWGSDGVRLDRGCLWELQGRWMHLDVRRWCWVWEEGSDKLFTNL